MFPIFHHVSTMIRIAGLRATDACLAPVCLCDMQQLCSRLMPQVCLLLVDKSSEVRDLALSVITSCTAVVRAYHKENKKPSLGSDEVAPSALPSGITAQPTAANGQSSSGWTTWAVDGFSKSIERVALNATANQSVSPLVEPSPTTQPPKGQTKQQESKPQKKADAWGDDDLDFEDEEETSPPPQSKQWSDMPSKSKPNTSVKLIDQNPAPDFDDWDEAPPPSSKSTKRFEVVVNLSDPPKTIHIYPKANKVKVDQPTIKKMPAPTHSSFDDWDDAPTQSHSNGQPPKSTIAPIADEFDDWGDDLDNVDLPPGEAWGDEDDLDLDLNVLGDPSTLLESKSKKTSASAPPISKATNNLPTTTLPATTPTKATPPAPASKAKVVTSTKKEKETSSSTVKKSSKPAPVVKKLAVSSSETDNWDDF